MEFEKYLKEASLEYDLFIARSFSKLQKFWWLIGLSGLIGLTLAFLFIRYSPKVYSVGAKVMIENSSNGIDPTSFLFGEQMIGNSQEVVNELIILKSYPIIRKTVVDQSQYVHYYRTTAALERVIEVEVKDSPFEVHCQGSWIYESGFPEKDPIKVLMRDEGFRIEGLTEFSNWGDTVLIDGKQLSLIKNSLVRTSEENLEYFFRIVSVEETVHHYQETISASVLEEKSSIINVQMDATHPVREIAFLEQMLFNYMKINLEEKNKGASNTIDFINRELTSIKDSLRKIESRLEIFKSRNQISNLQTEGQRIFEKLLELEEEKAIFELRQKYLDLVGEYLKEDDGAKLVTPASFGIEDPSLNTITETLLRLETERNLIGGDSRGEITAQLNARIRELRLSLSNYIANVSKTNKLQLQEVTRRTNLIENAIESLPVSEMALMNIERLHKLSESLYLLLLEKKAEAEITRSSNTPDIKLIESSRRLSNIPVKPNKKLIYLGLFVVSLVLPIGILLLGVYLDNSLRTKEEITQQLNLPFFGYVANATILSKYAILEQPKSRLSETFRTLRSNLKYLTKNEGAQVILVSSCFPGEGKTFVSSNLALSFASANKKVLVIGADLRKPQLQNNFELDNSIGLSSYLSGGVELSSVVIKTKQNVDVIVSGPIPPNPLELLDSGLFDELLEQARKSYDFVIIDTSPFVLVSDTTALFRVSDINLLVLRSGVSQRSNLGIISDLTESSDDCKFGLVLNDHEITNEYGYKYGKGYAQGYGYYEAS